MKLPDWAEKEEQYEPGPDRDYFISRSLLKLISLLAAIRQQGQREHRKISASLALLTTFSLILLVALAQTTAFLWAVLAGILVSLALQPAYILRTCLGTALFAAFFCLCLVAPSLYLGYYTVVFLLPVKTFLSVLLLCLLRENFSWHALTGALRFFHLPSLFIFLLDTTLRYIFLLGASARELLTALKIRSVGYNPEKSKAMGNIGGILLQKSHYLSQAMYEAMRCRCFTGEYLPYPTRQKAFTLVNFFLFFLLLLYLYLFFRLEGGY